MSRRLFGSLLGMVFLVSFGRTVFAPLVEPLQRAFGVGPATIGVAISLLLVGSALPRLPLSLVLTRVRREWVVLVAGGLLSLAAFVAAGASTPRLLQLSALFVGVASGVYFAAGMPLVGELYPGAVGRALGIHGAAAQIAAVVAPLVVVVVLSLTSWRAVFVLLAVAAFGSTAVFFLLLRRGDRAPDGAPNAPAPDLTVALTHWRVILAGLLMIAVPGFVWQGLFNFYVSFMLTRDVGVPLANTLLTVLFAAGVPAFWISGRVVDRVRTVPYIVSILFAFTLGVLALTVARGVVALVIVSLVVGYAIHSLFPALDAYILSSLPAESRAATYAAFSGISLIIQASSTAVIGVLIEAQVPFETIFRAFGAAVLVVALLLSLLSFAGRIPTPARDG